MPKTKEKVYKEFKYPNGKTLRLTKEDFEAIVKHFIWLDQQEKFLRFRGKFSPKEWVKVDQNILELIREHGSTEILRNAKKEQESL